MKLRGGYNVLLQGRPAGTIEVLDQPQVIQLPLGSSRFTFSQISVEDGQEVACGQVLATDPANYSVPLLAPWGGTVRLDAADGHIVLDQLVRQDDPDSAAADHAPDNTQRSDSVRQRCEQLLNAGAWQYFYDAHSGDLPDPFGTPQAVIVSTLNLASFVARGDAQIKENLTGFTRGLEHLQSLLEYQPIYLILPSVRSQLAQQIRQTVRGYAWIKLVDIPLRYGLGHFPVLARALGLKKQSDGPVWAMRAEGVLAVDNALTFSRPCIAKIISLAGPAVKSPTHLKVTAGYPLREILDSRMSGSAGEVRVINGGILDGSGFNGGQLGVDVECAGITVLDEPQKREMLSFVRPGSDRGSYSRCFLSSLRQPFAERLTTAVRGEGRPCISCGFCEEVCPVGIMPHLIHKLLYQDKIDEVQPAGVHRCVACGLCSFVCLSKIELRQQFIDANETIKEELAVQEVSE